VLVSYNVLHNVVSPELLASKKDVDSERPGVPLLQFRNPWSRRFSVHDRKEPHGEIARFSHTASAKLEKKNTAALPFFSRGP
jgi:hypothetical protein